VLHEIAVTSSLTSQFNRKIARLYRPLDTGSQSDLEGDDDDSIPGTQLLPIRENHGTSRASKGSNNNKFTRLTDVWDEREELFGIGPDSDEDDDDLEAGGTGAGVRPSRGDEGHQLPKIYVTSS
jgi:hypothetical protein